MKNETKLATELDLQTRFRDEQACRDYIEEKRWNGKPECPRCQSDKVYKFKNGKLWACGGCKKQFTVKVGTIFEDSPLPMIKWFHAIWILTAQKKGISSLQLNRDLGVTQKTAWHMLGRIRFMMKANSFNMPLKGTVQVDETYVGSKDKNKYANKQASGNEGPSVKSKTPVVGILENGGQVQMLVTANTKGSTILPIVNRRVKVGSVIVTDVYNAYNNLGKE